MYQDQGHIPMKLIDFDATVNVSLGIPIIRTSVDHGTAFDIAGKNLADPTNMKAAMRLAARMAALWITSAADQLWQEQGPCYDAESVLERLPATLRSLLAPLGMWPPMVG